jgi:hypothetical protein
MIINEKKLGSVYFYIGISKAKIRSEDLDTGLPSYNNMHKFFSSLANKHRIYAAEFY